MSVVKSYFGAGGVFLAQNGAQNGAQTDQPGKGAFCWADICQPSEDDLSWLESTYKFHPLTIEDCRHFDQRAKVEEYDGYLFITMAVPRHQSLYQNNGADELHFFLGQDYLVTVHADPMSAIDKVHERLAADRGKVKTPPDFLLYLLADQLVDRYFTILDDLEDEIEKVEDEIIAQPDRATLNRVFQLKQQLVYMRKTAGPERDLFHTLSGRRFSLIGSHTELYFRDLYDHIVRIYEGIETSRELLSNALDAYLSVISNRLNEVMKRLTLVATIFMPLSFVVGFGGMNFTALPFESRVAFAVLLTIIVSTPVLMMIWFWRKDWL